MLNNRDTYARSQEKANFDGNGQSGYLYEIARVAEGDSIVSSLPEEIRLKVASKGYPFDFHIMAFILCEKYAYHSSINTVKKKLRNMGAVLVRLLSTDIIT